MRLYLPFSNWFRTSNGQCPFLVTIQSVHGKYNMISVWFNKISKIFLCVYTHGMRDNCLADELPRLRMDKWSWSIWLMDPIHLINGSHINGSKSSVRDETQVSATWGLGLEPKIVDNWPNKGYYMIYLRRYWQNIQISIDYILSISS